MIKTGLKCDNIIYYYRHVPHITIRYRVSSDIKGITLLNIDGITVGINPYKYFKI